MTPAKAAGMTPAQTIHPNTPPKLVKKFQQAGSYHRLADKLKVNVYWIYRLMIHGEEPPDKTEKGRATRKALFLPARKRKPRRNQPIPDYLLWWKKQDQQTIIKQLYELNEKDKP